MSSIYGINYMIPLKVQIKQQQHLLKSVSLQIRKTRRDMQGQLFDYYQHPCATLKDRLAISSMEQRYLNHYIYDLKTSLKLTPK